MPGAAFLATIRLASLTGLSKDVCENSFAFAGTSPPTGPNLALLSTAINNFYSHLDGGATHSVAGYMSPDLDWASPMEIRWYDISSALHGEPHGNPFATTHELLTQGSAASPLPLPNQDAVVLSIVGPTAPPLVPGSGLVPSDESAVDQGAPAEHPATFRPQERIRGRLYIGPLNQGAVEMEATTKEPRVQGDFLIALRQAATKFVADTVAAAAWGIWSRRNGTIAPVVKGFIDNRFDSQRRRESAATDRVLFTIV